MTCLGGRDSRKGFENGGDLWNVFMDDISGQKGFAERIRKSKGFAERIHARNSEMKGTAEKICR